MRLKRFVSITICFMMLLPLFAKVVSANEVVNLCLNSGIANYYASVSKAAFDIVNVVFQDFLDISAQPSKKEVPPKQDAENNKNDQAIVPDNGTQKTLKTNLLPGIPLSFDISKDVYVSKLTGDGGLVSLGWMILLITMLILSIRKKDNSVVSLNNRVNTHPVLV